MSDIQRMIDVSIAMTCMEGTVGLRMAASSSSLLRMGGEGGSGGKDDD